MRVVTGEAKGRKLKGPKTSGTRPIMERVKQALFNILSIQVEDARFLDLFAGTGSVGIEALSRGAASATFIELNVAALKLVRENLQITGLAERAETLFTDAFKFLQAADAEHQQSIPSNIPGGGKPRHYARNSQSLPDGSVVAGLAPARTIKQYDMIYVAPPQYKGMAARALTLLDASRLVPETGLVIVQIHPKERSDIAT